MKSVTKSLFLSRLTFKTGIFQCLAIFLMVMVTMNCSAQKATASEEMNSQTRPQRGKRPSLNELFKLDANEDGKLDKSEAKDQLLRDFAKIDTNNDGFLTRNEVESASKPQRGKRPSLDEVFKLDSNKDGKLDKSEVKGQLKQDFAKIDTDKDGFLTRTEVENAPKPQRGQRPSRNNK